MREVVEREAPGEGRFDFSVPAISSFEVPDNEQEDVCTPGLRDERSLHVV